VSSETNLKIGGKSQPPERRTGLRERGRRLEAINGGQEIVSAEQDSLGANWQCPATNGAAPRELFTAAPNIFIESSSRF
jgi:hypothetical protein